MSNCSCAICRKAKLGQCSCLLWHVCPLQLNWRRQKSLSRWIYRFDDCFDTRLIENDSHFANNNRIQSQVGGSKFVFEARTIERMELLVLTTLGWRMQAVTPFSFIDHYLRKIHDDEFSLEMSIGQSSHLLLNIIHGAISILNIIVVVSMSFEMVLIDLSYRYRVLGIQTVGDCSSCGDIGRGGSSISGP